MSTPTYTDEITCEDCGSDNTDFAINYGSFTDAEGVKWSDDVLKCRDCGHRWNGLTPWEDDPDDDEQESCIDA